MEKRGKKNANKIPLQQSSYGGGILVRDGLECVRGVEGRVAGKASARDRRASRIEVNGWRLDYGAIILQRYDGLAQAEVLWMLGCFFFFSLPFRQFELFYRITAM